MGRIVDEVAKWGTTAWNMRQIGPGEKNILDKYVTNTANNVFYVQLLKDLKTSELPAHNFKSLKYFPKLKPADSKMMWNSGSI